jgi:tRNA(Ile)-lysidine synthase
VTPVHSRPLRAARRALKEAGVRPGDTVLAAVSGGVDSTVLLHLLAELREPLGFDLRAAHLNHGLRGAQADADAAFAVETCEQLGVPVTAAKRPVRQRPDESPHAAARRVRYRFLNAAARVCGAAFLATGHHADDLAETVLLRLAAGAGSGGLAAMARGSRGQGPVRVRPLLTLRKAELAAWAEARGIPWREDPSNADPRYPRARLRADVMPALEQFAPHVVESLGREARVLADEADLLQTQAAAALAPLRRDAGGAVVVDRAGLADLHPALLRWAVALLLAERLPGRGSAALVEAVAGLARGRTGRRVDLPGGVVAEASYGRLVLFRETAEAAAPGPVPLAVPGVTAVPWAGLALEAREGTPEGPGWARFDPSRFSGPLTVRPRVPGDRFHPAGLGGHRQKLKAYLIDRKVPRPLRDRTPLVVAPEGILWVVGMRQDERFVVKGRRLSDGRGARVLALRALPAGDGEAP